jgi:hypothetical protein
MKKFNGGKKRARPSDDLVDTGDDVDVDRTDDAGLLSRADASEVAAIYNELQFSDSSSDDADVDAEARQTADELSQSDACESLSGSSPFSFPSHSLTHSFQLKYNCTHCDFTPYHTNVLHSKPSVTAVPRQRRRLTCDRCLWHQAAAVVVVTSRPVCAPPS